jgi:hypothetical protein
MLRNNGLCLKCSKPGQYTLAEVLVATHKYAKQIGESLSGRVYWGKLQTGQEVAVKVWAEGSHQAATEFHIFRRVRSCMPDWLCLVFPSVLEYYH